MFENVYVLNQSRLLQLLPVCRYNKTILTMLSL